jgi:hypothetical protein
VIQAELRRLAGMNAASSSPDAASLRGVTRGRAPSTFPQSLPS